MFEPFKINRVLPPHELNARRDRKRVGNNLPALVHHQQEHPRGDKEQGQPNDHVFKPGANPFTQHD